MEFDKIDYCKSLLDKYPDKIILPSDLYGAFSMNEDADVVLQDVDGIPDGVMEADCKNECPFGYGIRADGKILPGARAEEWLKKDISGKK